MRNDRIRGGEDHLCRAIVLLQFDRPCLGIVLFKIHDIADIRAAPAIDGLIRVTYDTEVVMLLRQKFGEPVLRAVRVLILIHENISEPVLILFTDILMLLQKNHGNHQQIVKIQRVVFPQFLCIQMINIGNLLLKEIPCLLFKGTRSLQKILRIGNPVLYRGRRILLLIQIQFLDAVLDDGLGITGIIDNKIFLIEFRCFDFPAQEPRAKRVESAEPDFLGAFANHAVHAIPHLRRSLVREGDG